MILLRSQTVNTYCCVSPVEKENVHYEYVALQEVGSKGNIHENCTLSKNFVLSTKN